MRVWPGSLSCQHKLLSLCHLFVPSLPRSLTHSLPVEHSRQAQPHFRSRPFAVTPLLLFVKGMNSSTLTENQEDAATLALQTTRSIKALTKRRAAAYVYVLLFLPSALGSVLPKGLQLFAPPPVT